MDRLPNLLLLAWLLPLASFTVICISYSVPQFFGINVRYEAQKYAAYISIGAIVAGFLLSMTAMFGSWLPAHPLAATSHHAEAEHEKEAAATPANSASPFKLAVMQTGEAT